MYRSDSSFNVRVLKTLKSGEFYSVEQKHCPKDVLSLVETPFSLLLLQLLFCCFKVVLLLQELSNTLKSVLWKTKLRLKRFPYSRSEMLFSGMKGVRRPIAQDVTAPLVPEKRPPTGTGSERRDIDTKSAIGRAPTLTGTKRGGVWMLFTRDVFRKLHFTKRFLHSLNLFRRI